MTSRSRVSRLGGLLGVDTGRKVECPACDGLGRQDEVDGPWRALQIAKRFADISAQVATEQGLPAPEPFTEAEPAERMEPCGLCRGSRLTTEARLVARQRPAGGIKAAMVERIERIARALTVTPSAEPVEATMPTPKYPCGPGPCCPRW